MMNSKQSLFGLWFVLLSNIAFSQTVVFENEVSGTWSKANSPYIILRNILIPEDTSLIIEPGVEVQFTSNFGMKVEGNLLAIGNTNDRIIFTSTDTLLVQNDITLGWKGISIIGENADTSIFENCVIEYVYKESSYDHSVISINKRTVIINKCNIENNVAYYGGVYCAEGSGLMMLNSVISENQGKRNYGGIYLIKSNALIMNNLLIGKGTQIAVVGKNISSDTIRIYNNTIITSIPYTTHYHNNTVINSGGLVNMQNCIIWDITNTSSEAIGVYGSGFSTFENCILKNGKSGIRTENGNISCHNVYNANPYFVDFANWDFTLTDSSYAINTGKTYNPEILSLMPYDMAGNQRIFDGAIDRIDIGTYEFQGDAIPNRPPSVNNPGTAHIFTSSSKEMIFSFSDVDEVDTHTLSVTTSNPNISIGALSAHTTDANYTITPLSGWNGTADVILSVTDDHGAQDVDTFAVIVNDTVNYDIVDSTIWDINTVYIGSNFKVKSNATLEIKAGTNILFIDNYTIEVEGVIKAFGLSGNKIRFAPIDTNGFTGNTHKGWGGIKLMNANDTSLFYNCVFEYAKNKCVISATINSSVEIINCIFRDNITNHYSEPSVIRCEKAKVFIGNSLFYDNSMYYHTIGSIYSDFLLLNNTFCNNSGRYSVVSFGTGIASIKNCIFWRNITRDNETISSSNLTDFTISNCIIEKGEQAIKDFNSNLTLLSIYNVSPQFTDITGRDLHLQPYSPAINLGINDPQLVRLNNVDLDSNTRVFNGSVLLPDIGAYEYQGEPVNRKPVIKTPEDATIMLGSPIERSVNFFDADESDTHTITITSQSPEITVQNLSGDTTGSEYTLVPASGYNGTSIISVIVEDNGGLEDSVSYNLQVSQSACGSVHDDMTWDDDTIYVNCDIIVEENATLTIAPGTKVIYNGPYMLDVYGVLKAVGADNDTIVFMLNDTITFNDTVYANAWKGININPQKGQDTSEIKYCEIQNSQNHGIHIGRFANAIISRCNIHHNLIPGSANGGGIMEESTNYIPIENNYIHHNKSGYYGGGIYSSYGTSYIVNNTITNNSAQEAGGLYGSGLIKNNIVEYNEASNGNGGGIKAGGNSSLIQNTVRKNSTNYNGGGIYIYSSLNNNTDIINNKIEDNSCNNTSNTYGGGIYISTGKARIINNIVTNNSSNMGGAGIFYAAYDGVIVNNAICNNSSDGDGLGIFMSRKSSSLIANNILWDTAANQIYIRNQQSALNIENCIIQGGQDGITFNEDVENNGIYKNIINTNPGFNDASNNDFSLSDSSICINNGKADTSGLYLPMNDISGNARIFDGNVDRIDIGAYEYIGEPANRRPVLSSMEDIELFSSRSKQMKVEYIDSDFGDTHSLTIKSSDINLTIENLTGDTSGSTYDIVAAPDWQGLATVKVEVEDTHGLKDSAFYLVEVSDSVCGEITNNIIWDKDTVFVTCDITIPADKTLTITPGTVILLMGNFEFHVYGTLIAEGTEQERIVFIRKDTSIADPKIHWKGIYFHSYSSSADTSKLCYCDVQSGNVRIVRDKVIVSNCLFNKSNYVNGGGLCIFNASPTIENCIFSNNHATNTGGGISIIDNDYFDNHKTRPVIKGNEFYNNSATHGGAIFSGETGANLSNNIIHHNTAVYGGAVYLYEYGLNPVLQNNLIYENTATSYGGAICYDDCSKIYQFNNTIVNNKSIIGGALYFQSYSYPRIYNDIIYFNETNQNGSQIFIHSSYSAPIFNYCFVQYGFDSIAGNGSGIEFRGKFDNVYTENPFFADTANNNYQLSDSSYCINTGTMNLSGNMILPEHDIIGNARVFAGSVSNIDVGAYEFQGNPKNRKPIIIPKKDQYTLISERKKLSVNFTDVDKTDSHIITISTGNINVTVENISGSVSGSTYELVPVNKWEGVSEVFVKVEDNKGNFDVDTFNLIVSDYFCGSITENTLWDKDTIKILCDVTIEKGATLTILPGTVITFDDFVQLKVLGKLIAVGTRENRIIFTSSDITGYPDVTYKGWRGIRFYGPNTSGTSKLEYCTIQYAKGTNNGFTIDAYGGGLFINNWHGILITNCQISNNTAVERGGGLYCNSSRGKVLNTIISNNYANRYGGGLFITGSFPNTYLINNVICNNFSGSIGGGIYAKNLYSLNNMIVNNKSNSGGGLELTWGLLYNTIIWGNTANYYPQFNASYSSSVYLNNGVLENGLTNIGYNTTAIKTYENMIEQNPQFVLPSQGSGTDYNGLTANWSLLASSPCINTGTTNIDEYHFELPETDISGESRILMDSIDMGAYEFHNLAPYKIGNLKSQEIPAGVNSNINILMEDFFVDDNLGDVLTYSIAGDSVPQWISSNSVGTTLTIMASPAVTIKGSFKIIVEATDLFGEYAFDTLVIKVLANQPPKVEHALADIEIHALQNFSYVIPDTCFVDPDDNDILAYNAVLEDGSNLPGWLSFDEKVHAFTGIPQVSDIGVHTIVVTATDMANYSVKDTFNITVLDPLLIPGVIFPNYKIYPIPADGYIYIEFGDIEIDKHNIELYDIDGKIIDFKARLNDNKIKIDISKLPAGIYCISLVSGEIVITKKIILK